LVQKPGGKRPLGISKRRCKDNIQMDVRGTGYGDGRRMELAQGRVQWQDLRFSRRENLQVVKDFVL
jgi:hypothetical protein